MDILESLLKDWDGESVLVHLDRPTGVWIFIALHSTQLGPATGGTRMKSYRDNQEALRDALRLARGMTYKFATPGLPNGGGKGVINLPEDFDLQSRPDLLRRYGALVNSLGGLFLTGPDLGTSSPDMDIVAETGAPYIFGCTPAAGGPGSPGPFTALGVYTGIQVVCEQLFGEDSLKNRRVLVQGAGSVGKTLIEYLVAEKAEVLFSDVDDDTIHHFRDELGLDFISPETVYSSACDIFAPCALGGVFNESTIPQLKCKAIVGGANNQLNTPEDAERLQKKGILYAPDYVVNVGGAMALIGQEAHGWTAEETKKKIIENVRSALGQIFDMASKEGITTDKAAHHIAEDRISAASKQS